MRDAHRDQGGPKARLEQDVMKAHWVLERLSGFGIGIDRVTQQLEDESVEKFNKPFDQVMETLAQGSPADLPRKREHEAVESWRNEGNPN